MSLIMVGNGETVALKYLTNNAAPEDLVLRLYTNNHTPGFSDTAGSYTEATGSGYSAVSLTAGNWGFSGSDPATATYVQVTFTFTGALGNVYGYYITRASSADLLWAEKFGSGPFNIQNNGDQIKLVPVITGT